MMRGWGVVVSALLVVAVVAGLSSAAGEYGAGPRRRSLHQPFFPTDPTPPPASDESIVPPPPPPDAAAASASKGGGRSGSSVTNAVAIALVTGLVALAVAFYSCFLLWRRRSDGGGGGGRERAAKSVRGGSAAFRVASDVGSSARHQRSPPPSSTASDAIYLDPLTTTLEVSRHPHRQESPELLPLALVKPPSPDLRPLPPLKRPAAAAAPPAPASTPPMTTTVDSSDEEDKATYYTAPKTAMSSFSRSTSQRSTVEQTVTQPPAPTPAPTPPPQENPPRPTRPPPPPPPPRQRLVRPMPAETAPSAVLASLALTNSPDPELSAQDRGGDDPDGHRGSARPPKPPSLKPLHWDKLRAISGRTTVWDQVNNSDSFRVDEAAMESLFLNNTGGVGSSDQAARRGGAGKQESRRLLDPKRLQNVAIMLKALNVTSGDVVGALMHGNGDLGSEFYEALAKMAPTKEEELKLKDYSGDISKLDPAEHFLKDVLEVPFAFKRVDAMLYRANFDTEVNYLKKSFGTLEAACADLRSSKLFLKLLDAVLKTGNRMNDGTNRGEARAFKLDTLLKLADIKSTDGKTTVLHFVVQEIIRSESLGSDQPAAVNPGSTSKEQFKKDGLKVLAGLSSELSNVKRAATLEMDTLVGNVSRLETDLEKVTVVSQLKETCPDQDSSEKFFEAMDAFLRRAQAEIEAVKAAGESALQRVKETTEYFHGDATKEEPHPLRIFMVVSDFLATLDRVCRDVGRTPERVMMGSGKSFRVPAGSSLTPRRYEPRRELSSDDDDSSSS